MASEPYLMYTVILRRLVMYFIACSIAVLAIDLLVYDTYVSFYNDTLVGTTRPDRSTVANIFVGSPDHTNVSHYNTVRPLTNNIALLDHYVIVLLMRLAVLCVIIVVVLSLIERPTIRLALRLTTTYPLIRDYTTTSIREQARINVSRLITPASSVFLALLVATIQISSDCYLTLPAADCLSAPALSLFLTLLLELILSAWLFAWKQKSHNAMEIRWLCRTCHYELIPGTYEHCPECGLLLVRTSGSTVRSFVIVSMRLLGILLAISVPLAAWKIVSTHTCKIDSKYDHEELVYMKPYSSLCIEWDTGTRSVFTHAYYVLHNPNLPNASMQTLAWGTIECCAWAADGISMEDPEEWTLQTWKSNTPSRTTLYAHNVFVGPNNESIQFAYHGTTTVALRIDKSHVRSLKHIPHQNFADSRLLTRLQLLMNESLISPYEHIAYRIYTPSGFRFFQSLSP